MTERESIPRCSCYDADCYDVEDPLLCWIGNELLGGPADGYCPLLRPEQPTEKEAAKECCFDTE